MVHKRNRLIDIRSTVNEWLLRKSPGDRLIISVTCYMDSSTLTDEMFESLITRGLTNRRRPTAILATPFHLPTIKVASRSTDGLQEAFIESLTTLRQGLRDAAIDDAFVKTSSARIIVYTTLQPVTGMSDVILTPDVLTDWQDLRASFRFDVLK